MAVEFHLMMQVEKDHMDLDTAKKLINFLVESEYIQLDMPVEVWEVNGEYYEEDDCYDDLEHDFDSIGEFYKKLPELNIEKINFEVGIDHYDEDLTLLEKEGRLPGINKLTNQLKKDMDDFCIKNAIEPAIDVFGGVTFGLIQSSSEDGLLEKRGVGIYCDGNVAQSMEDAGFLNSFDKSSKVYKFFEEIAAVLDTAVTLKFRY